MIEGVRTHLGWHLGILYHMLYAREMVDFSIQQYDGKPDPGRVTYVTLGISRHLLGLSDGRLLRQELVFSCDAKTEKGEVASLLFKLGAVMLRKHWAVDQDEVIGPYAPYFNGTDKTCLFVSSPTLFPDEFAVYRGTRPPTIFPWLIPITSDEALFIREQGADAFTDLLAATEEDLWNVHRRSVIAS